MKIWLDDERPAPKGWMWLKTSKDVLFFLRTYPKLVEEISFDHDLGEDDTSMIVARHIEEQAYHGQKKPPKWNIHSANPVGSINLKICLQKADEYWETWISSDVSPEKSTR